MEDALAQFQLDGEINGDWVLILVVMEDALAQKYGAGVK